MMSIYKTLKSGTLKRSESRKKTSDYSVLACSSGQNHQSEVKNSIENKEKMVSRRKILSRSKDDLNFETFHQDEEDIDVWYQKEKLFKEHIQEVLDKWNQIDDEIWAKIIVFEKNRRVAKAYARTPVLTINGSDDGFDGMRIGLCGFDNPVRDQKTEEVKFHIGQGIKLKMDESGNILVRRYSKSGVFVKGTGNAGEETAIGNEILKSPNLNLELDKVMKVFDMKKFESNLNRELGRAYPDRRRLETQCLSIISFVKTEQDVLECPIWVLIVNVVAIDMLRSKLPPMRRPLDIKNRPRIPIPDEKIDPYAITEDSATSSSFGIYGHSKSSMLIPSQFHRRDKPPKLPPRDNIYVHRDIANAPLKNDYDEIESEHRIKLMFKGRGEKNKNPKSYDDPYYSGLRARVPNFSKGKERRESQTNEEIYVSRRQPRVSRRSIASSDRHQPTFSSLYQLNQVNDPRSSLYQRLHHHGHSSHSTRPVLWHARSYESGIDSEIVESTYQPIYGRVHPGMHLGAYRNMRRPSNFVGDWE